MTHNILVKSPLRYTGGKSRAVHFLTKQIPDFQEYREPFLGGGSMFVHLKQLLPDRIFWINDIYYDLYELWNNSRVNINPILTQIRGWRKAYSDGKELHRFLLNGLPNFSSIETASAFFILNRITFSGTSESSGFSMQAFEKRFTDSSIERLAQLPKVLADVKITNLDYQEVVEAKGKDVFIFLDPPYFSAKKSALYGKNGNLHKEFDHKRFADVVCKCSHKWMIIYDDSPYIRSLFSFAVIEEWQLTYGMRNIGRVSKQKQTELLITNF